MVCEGQKTASNTGCLVIHPLFELDLANFPFEKYESLAIRLPVSILAELSMHTFSQCRRSVAHDLFTGLCAGIHSGLVGFLGQGVRWERRGITTVTFLV